MTTDIWNDGTILGLLGRYISVTGGSRRYRYEGVLVSVDDVSKTFTLARKFRSMIVTESAWVNLSEKQRENHWDRFMKLKAKTEAASAMSITSDGMRAYKLPKSSGKKPNQKRRQRSERTSSKKIFH